MAKAPGDVLSQAVRLLAATDKTREALKRSLEHKGHGVGEIDRALSHLETLGYLDDLRVVRRKALAQLKAGFCGEVLEARLTGLGVSSAVAQRAIDEARAELDWQPLAVARALLAGTGRSGAKAARFLASRGFDGEVIEQLVPELNVSDP
jgi:SOS response regulatory protein OraA/RecX